MGSEMCIRDRFYLGVDEDSSSSNLITDDLGIYGSGKYVIRQGVGGAGLAWILVLFQGHIEDGSLALL